MKKKKKKGFSNVWKVLGGAGWRGNVLRSRRLSVPRRLLAQSPLSHLQTQTTPEDFNSTSCARLGQRERSRTPVGIIDAARLVFQRTGREDHRSQIWRGSYKFLLSPE